MALDFMKILNAALLPTGGAVLIGLLGIGIGFVPLLGCISIFFIPLTFVVLAVAGFLAVKQQGQDLVGGTIAGTLAGTVHAIIIGILRALLGFLGVAAFAGSSLTGSQSGMGSYGTLFAGLGALAVIAELVIGILFWLVLGIVAGLLGAIIAGLK